MTNEETIWQAVKGELEVVLSKANFTTWLKDTFIDSLKEKEAIIGVPNTFTQDWLENKYHPKILEALKKISPNVETITYKVITKVGDQKAKVQQMDLEVKPQEKPLVNAENNPTLNPKYTFDNFVVGGSNRLAHATAQAVASKPGMVYNPLFLYGGVGLGKTHLVQAIGNEIIKKNPKKKIIYVSCEKFTNDFIQSISSGKINDFKKQYRDADVLLVDDIQFLAGKEGTQEEFFYTFNTLHQTNRQIVMTSDRVPKAIPQLEERLSSRFSWGMVADIQPPNLEMRQAVMRSKCEEKGCHIDDEIINFIAQNLESNIREIEGAITRVISYCELNKIQPTMEIAAKVLEDVISAKGKNLTVEKIFKAVGDHFNTSTDDIMSIKRNRELVHPRQIIMYLLRHEMNLSYPKIGKELNKKDHTTIMHGVGKIEKEIIKNNELQKEIIIIKEKLYIV